MVADGQFILTVGNHFIGLRKKDGCLEVNHGHRSHEWQSACRWQTGVAIGFSEDLGQWLISPSSPARTTRAGPMVEQNLGSLSGWPSDRNAATSGLRCAAVG